MSLWLLLACAEEASPCLAMCEAGASLYGGGLADWGADWSAAGYADGDDFVDACATWTYEMYTLEAEAGREGEVDATCHDRLAAFEADGATCDDFTGVDWSTPPWLD